MVISAMMTQIVMDTQINLDRINGIGSGLAQ
ncbi:MAG: hypothetical protein KatS3mg087_1849 [Patescibacteria group bacterium]|nr:MAG: hypothetical protein KatS3mg087_1849 [Patescibacteria group bacterium]